MDEFSDAVTRTGGTFRGWGRRLICAVVVTSVALLPGLATGAPPEQMSGAIFTTDSACDGTNVNIFEDKGEVYLDGGPAHPGAAGLPDGEYYVQVTEPNGTLLGTSIGSVDDTPAVVSGGAFAVCYQLEAILITASDQTPGYDDTSNAGGEYKVWVSSVGTFDSSASKTDNFKVKAEECTEDCFPEEPPGATLNVNKFYDANANGLDDDSQPITGWKIRIQDGIDYIRFTPVTIVIDPDEYVVTEFSPVETNWVQTTPNPVNITLAQGDNSTVTFGNLCLGAGGGHTLGFWSNKNGKAAMNDGGSLNPELALLAGLNLRSANGNNFDPATYDSFKTWILGATATNMANMLSAQLAAMALNVEVGNVSGGALIYAPGATSANTLGFASVSDVMSEANTSLGAFGSTVSPHAERAHQEALKNALDAANNNRNFVQSIPCAFSFAA